MKCVVFLCRTIKIWFQTELGRENSASYYRQGRRLLLTLLTMVTRWSRSSSNFYAPIAQKLTGEFTRKIYAASWILFALTVEADRVLCQLVMFLTVFFHWMYKMKFSCYRSIRSLLLLMTSLSRHLSKSEIRFRSASFSFHTFPWCVRGLQRLKWYLPYLIPFRAASRMVSLSNYCIWFLDVCFFISNNIHEKIIQFWLAEKGVQFFCNTSANLKHECKTCNTSANYKCFLIGWKKKQKKPPRTNQNIAVLTTKLRQWPWFSANKEQKRWQAHANHDSYSFQASE